MGAPAVSSSQDVAAILTMDRKPIDRDDDIAMMQGPSPAPQLSRWVLRHRLAICLGTLLLLFLAAGGLPRLTLSSDYEVYFDADDPQLAGLNRLYAVFSRNDSVLFAIIPDSGDALTRPSLLAIRDLTDAAWQLPYAVRVDSVANYQHIESDGDEVDIGAVIPGDVPDDDLELGRIREVLLGARGLRNRLLSDDAGAAGISVRLELTGDRQESMLHAAESARALARRIEAAHAGIDVRVSGNTMLNAAFPEASVIDVKVLTPLMYFGILLLLALLLRSIAAAGYCLLVVMVSSISAMGIAGWLGFEITSASVAAPTIISTVAVADSMHLLSVLQRLRSRGVALEQAVAGTLGINLQPVAITSLTTTIGFLSLNFSDSPPFRDLGTITAIGVTVAFVVSVISLPALIAQLGARPRPARKPIVDLHRSGLWFVRHRARLFVIVIAAGAAGASLVGRMELNDAFVEYFDERVEFRRDTDVIMERLTGIYQLEYAIPAGSDHGINDPDFLRVLDAFGAWLTTQPEVMHVNSIVDVVKRLNRHVAGGEEVLPGDRDTVAQLLLLYENSVPYGLDLNAYISVARDATRLTVTLRNLDNVALRGLETRAAAWLSENAPESMRAPATGPAILFAYVAQRNIEAMLTGGVLAVLVIAVVLGGVFRSWRLGLMSLLPNLLPAVIAFGIWAVLVGQMGIALAIVAAMSLGVVVDDTVHFVAHVLDGRRRLGLPARSSVHHAFVTTGPALVSTSIVLVAGFSVLTLSAYEVNQGMGQLTALVIVCALLADFAMLPWLLVQAMRRGWV